MAIRIPFSSITFIVGNKIARSFSPEIQKATLYRLWTREEIQKQLEKDSVIIKEFSYSLLG